MISPNLAPAEINQGPVPLWRSPARLARTALATLSIAVPGAALTPRATAYETPAGSDATPAAVFNEDPLGVNFMRESQVGKPYPKHGTTDQKGTWLVQNCLEPLRVVYNEPQYQHAHNSTGSLAIHNDGHRSKISWRHNRSERICGYITHRRNGEDRAVHEPKHLKPSEAAVNLKTNKIYDGPTSGFMVDSQAISGDPVENFIILFEPAHRLRR